MQFYILMVDYGKGLQHPMGLEAVVSPEQTRRQVVEEVRNIIRKGRNTVAFVKLVDGNFIEDITEEIVGEATDGPPLVNYADQIEREFADRISSTQDHARKLKAEA